MDFVSQAIRNRMGGKSAHSTVAGRKFDTFKDALGLSEHYGGARHPPRLGREGTLELTEDHG